MTARIEWRARMDPFFLEILPEFIANLQMESARLPTLLASGDLREVARIAHNFKGTASQFGLAELGCLARTLEIHAKAGDQPTITADIASWQHLLDQFGLTAN